MSKATKRRSFLVMRTPVCVLTVLVFYLAFSSHLAAVAQVSSKLRIGVILPLSGDMGKYGKNVLNGAKLALAEVEREDPNLAKRIELITFDDRSSSEVAAKGAKQLLSSKRVNLFFGSITSSTTLPLAQFAVDSRRPLIVPVSSHPSLTQQGPYVFRSCFADSLQGTLLAKFVLTTLKKKKAAVLVDSASAYSRTIGAGFKKSFERKGGSLTHQLRYEKETTDFQVLLQELRRNTPDVLVMPGHYQEAAKVIQAVKALALPVTIVGGDQWDSPELFKIVPRKALSKHFYLSHYSMLANGPKAMAFNKSYRKRYREAPNLFAAMGYDGMVVAIDAFRRAKNSLNTALTPALKTVRKAEGVLGRIAMPKSRNAVKPAIVMSLSPSGGRYHSLVRLLN